MLAPFAAALALLLCPLALAQPQAVDLPNWPESARPAYIQYETVLNATPTRESLLAWHQLLASEPHVAGTPGDLREVDRIAKAFTDMGLEVRKHEFWAYLARPVAAAVEVIAPEHIPLLVKEEALAEDTFSGSPEQMIGWNAYSGSGDVTAPVIYANYGTKADFAKLAELNIDVKGKVVICRYGGNFRGYKAKFAQNAGALGVLIFTDPADSGYGKGITYPEGGFSNSTCIERGSINALDYPGDPLTPGTEATETAKRLDPGEVDLPKIPVQPVSWSAANEILKRMAGEAVPTGWQGGLPFAYRITGGDPLKVRLMVKQDRKIIPTFNVIATLKGATEPDHWMIVGCHHDAWNCGAADPLAGTITLLESAKSFALQAKAGKPPARTILFCAWGAEEFGITGSTEWVEGNRDALIKNAVAYINLDMASMGVDFGASSSPSLRRLIAQCAKAVPQARDSSKTVYQAWLARGEDPILKDSPKFGDLGGGSDHIAFLCHCGIPSTSLGAGGSKGNSYHSVYDTLPWYWKVVGEDYEPAIMVTRMTNAVAGRLANAPLIPLDPANYARETSRQLGELTRRGIELGVFPKTSSDLASPFQQLSSIALELAGKAAELESILQATVERGHIPDLSRANESLILAERAWLSESGIPGRAWFKNLYAASDEDSGYAAWVLPGLRWCIEHKDPGALTARVDQCRSILQNIVTELIDGIP